MDPWVYAVIGLCLLVLVLLVVTLVALRRLARRERHLVAQLSTELAAARSDVADLGTRLEELSTQTTQASGLPDRADFDGVAEKTPSEVVTPYLITELGEPDQQAQALPVEARFVTAVESARPIWVPAQPLRASLVGVVAVSHGLRRALSADARDRIWMEMQVEMRRSRRRRRAEIKAARKYLREKGAA
ncbi:MAG: hypothetical protein HZY75_10425 [Nocardioidaceae bacterium]|nr:MAG: hypothetical protein HZY75_10425 [Nocardioidaceae bacterium]